MTPALDVPTRIRSAIATLILVASIPIALDRGVAKGMGFQDSCYLTLPQGDVRGLDFRASCAFLGIPYAASPAGGSRWKPPQPRAAWSPAVVDARTGVPQCPQVQLPQGVLLGSEDCLFMNVWTRDLRPAALAPVVVWLHTGAFIGASANFAGSNGRTFAEQTGAVVVAPNYRVGPLGFLAHRALAAEDAMRPTSGNYGFLDQQAALRWVQENIARFGGDPNNVTLAGTSAGGASVGLHLVSPGSAGLYHRAILQSAYLSTTRWTTHQQFSLTGDAWATAIGCTDPSEVLACMRSKTRDQVLTAIPVGTLQIVEPVGRVYWEPVVDGLVVPDQPRALFESGAFHRVPTIIGFNRDEGWGSFITRSFPTGVTLAQYEGWVMNEFGPHGSSVLDIYPASSFASPIEAMARVTADAQFACEGRRLARLIERTRTPIYMYSYEHEIDDLSLDHVIHGVESNIVFGNNYVPPIFAVHDLNDVDRLLHADMLGYWSRFSATGNPNGSDAVHWPEFKHPTGRGRGSDKYIVLDSAIREDMRLQEVQCNFFEPFFLRSLLGGVPASAQ
jgi:para-nitrobenzyl esterase